MGGWGGGGVGWGLHYTGQCLVQLVSERRNKFAKQVEANWPSVTVPLYLSVLILFYRPGAHYQVMAFFSPGNGLLTDSFLTTFRRRVDYLKTRPPFMFISESHNKLEIFISYKKKPLLSKTFLILDIH